MSSAQFDSCSRHTPAVDVRSTQVYSRTYPADNILTVNLDLVDVLQSIGIWDKVK